MVSFYYLVIAVIVLILLLIYRNFRNNLWEKLGIFYMPGWPIVGNDARFCFGFETNIASQARKYRYIGKHKYGGTYMLAVPFLHVKDTTIIESVLIKDFTNFYDRGLPVNEKVDPLQANLFNLEGKRWKNLRNKLSPVFTSGKLKTMHHALIECADVLMEVLETYSGTGQPCDFKETVAKFTTDVIGSCAYGINMNSLKDDDSQFRKMGKRIFNPSIRVKVRSFLRQIIRSIHPKLGTWINMKGFPKEIDDFFINLVKDTIKLREEDPKNVRNDFIQLLINLREQDDTGKPSEKLTGTSGNNNPSTGDEVILDHKVMAANAFIFFVAGFETTASTISYCLFELSKNPQLQDRVHEEILNVLSKYNGEPTYEAIKEMPLLDMTISETLRKYPPVPFLFRVCTESYKLPDSDVVLPKGTRVDIPVYSLHHDPEIYEDPEEFIPERFSVENRDKIPKGAYLPFGDGPRICIGIRFAQMEMKVALSKILTKYRVTKNPKTPDVLIFDPKSLFLMVPKCGIWLDIEKR